MRIRMTKRVFELGCTIIITVVTMRSYNMITSISKQTAGDDILISSDSNSFDYFEEAQPVRPVTTGVAEDDEGPTVAISSVAQVRDDDSEDGTVNYQTTLQKQSPPPSPPPRKQEKSETRTGDPPICELKPNTKSVILMTLGRSGSSSTWQVMTALTGLQTRSKEFPASTTRKIDKFFTKKVKRGNNGNWALEFLCSQQSKYPNAGITGFKWKPSLHSITSQVAIETFEVMKQHYTPQQQQQQPNNASIQIIRSRRNLLDVIISRTKHSQTDRLKSHCKINNEKCLQKQLLAGSKLHLDTNELLDTLNKMTIEENMVDELLKMHGVSHLPVSYEKLYYGDDVTTSVTNSTTIMEEEWMKIFRFLGIGPSQNLTIDTIQNAMEHVSTSNRQHKITLENYNDVKTTLKGTAFELLLH